MENKFKNTFTLEEAYDKAVEFEADTQVIGIQKEKILHRSLKYFLCNDPSFHEVKVAKETKGCLYADIKIDDQIIEIQTRNFNALREKLTEFLKKYQVTVVYPIPMQKMIIRLDENHHMLTTKKSPRKGNPLDIFYELYKIKSYLNHPHLSFKIILLDVDEYRKITPKKYYRSSGYVKEVQVPKKIRRIINLKTDADYVNLLDEYHLPDTFISKEFAKLTHLTAKKAGVTLNVLTSMHIVERVSKVGRSYVYKVKK